MSNALAIAHVTQALALLIENNLRPEIDMAVSVETRRPPTEPPTEPTITVFLYQVTPNASMRHHDLPTRSSDGTLLKRAAAPLDLHFLITAYGEETELVGQRLIGCVVRTLHEIPVLPRELIEEAATRPHLEGSDLAESIQKVRFTPTQMDVDETSKLWGMLHQTPYSLSVVYTGALVLVEGREQPTPPPPVERHTVRVAPFGAPGAPERPDLPEPVEAGAEAAGTAGTTEAAGTAGTAGAGREAGADGRAQASADAAGRTAKPGRTRAGGGAPVTGRGAAAEPEAKTPSAAAKRAAGESADKPAAPKQAAQSAAAKSGAKSTAKGGDSSAAASRTRKAAGRGAGGRGRRGTKSAEPDEGAGVGEEA